MTESVETFMVMVIGIYLNSKATSYAFQYILCKNPATIIKIDSIDHRHVARSENLGGK